MHLLVLLLVASVLLFDALGGQSLASALGFRITSAEAAALTIAPMVFVTLMVWLISVRFGRLIDRTGRIVFVRMAQRASRIQRWGVTLSHVVGVLVFGWASAVRSVVGGDLILLDEAIAILPAVCFLASSWVIHYPIERRLRDAEILRFLDLGKPVHQRPGALGYASDHMRHQVLIVLAPLLAIIAWRETVGRAVYAQLDGSTAETVTTVLEFAGVLAVLALMPLAMRHIWRTAPLSEGPLRERLLGMCARSGVRTRDLLVWLTHGAMYNGAVVGILGASRYILLTDGLLEELHEKQVEAVMAHEIAHVVHRHIGWLIAALMGVAVLSGAVFGLGLDLYAVAGIGGTRSEAFVAVAEFIAVALAMVSGLLAFGHVSRRFERQADAYAVRMLAEERAGELAVISEDDTREMIGALDRVAMLNHIPRGAFMWRHGSIRSRQHALATLDGARTDAMPIDRSVRRIKRATLLIVAIATALAALGM